jgi:LPXTG-motif cell wall-anchored protein
MRRLTIVGAAVGAFVLTTLALAGPAQAGPGDPVWKANGESSITGQHTVKLVGDNTSVEAADLGVDVEAGAVVSFSIALSDGAVCSAGAPRVFVVVNGTNTNSWDQNVAAGKQCGEEGTVSFTIPAAGTIGQAGVVYDNGTAGTVVVSDLRIGGELVNFEAVEPGGEPTISPTVQPTGEPTVQPTGEPTVQPTGEPTVQPTGEPTVQPTGEPTAEPSASVSTSPAAGAGGGLPVTGANVAAFAAVGVVLVLAGVALVLVRRRRVSFDA